MNDSWEDWTTDDYIIPILNIQTQEQLKRLKEQKLIEEADEAISRDLFNNINNYSNKEIYNQQNFDITICEEKKIYKREKKISNQKLNEIRQKEQSKIIKEQKTKQENAKELYGESEYIDEYAEYEDKFN